MAVLVNGLSSYTLPGTLPYAEIHKCDTPLHHLCIPLHKGIAEKIPKEELEALIHTTWYQKVGPTKIRYLLAILIIERVLEKEATSTKIAEMVGVKPSSVSRPLRDLREAQVTYQDKPRGPYKLGEMLAEDLYGLRSEKGEFDRDEVAKRKAKDQRRFYRYEVKLRDTILRFIEDDGVDPDHALKLAKDLILPPRGIDEYDLDNHQEWALNWARREYKRSQGENGSKQTGRARRTDDARLRRDIRENHFREGEEGG
jgi:DNA-binding transcriptional ArsR family regulator